MRASSKFLALALSAALQPALASVVTLDFEDITSVTQLASRYGDVKFTNNAWGVTADDEDTSAVCNGIYLFEPLAKSGRNCGALLLGESARGTAGSSGFSFTISSDFGFLNSIGFAFALRDGAEARIDIYDGFGKLLNGLDLTGDYCHSGFFFCNWQTGKSIDFSGVARTIVVSSKDQRLMLDDLVLNTAAAPTRVPEPGSIALAFGALGALGWARKRAAR